jgi:hypothetical protein
MNIYVIQSFANNIHLLFRVDEDPALVEDGREFTNGTFIFPEMEIRRKKDDGATEVVAKAGSKARIFGNITTKVIDFPDDDSAKLYFILEFGL